MDGILAYTFNKHLLEYCISFKKRKRMCVFLSSSLCVYNTYIIPFMCGNSYLAKPIRFAILISHLKYYHNKQYNIELLRSFSYIK